MTVATTTTTAAAAATALVVVVVFVAIEPTDLAGVSQLGGALAVRGPIAIGRAGLGAYPVARLRLRGQMVARVNVKSVSVAITQIRASDRWRRRRKSSDGLNGDWRWRVLSVGRLEAGPSFEIRKDKHREE